MMLTFISDLTTTSCPDQESRNGRAAVCFCFYAAHKQTLNLNLKSLLNLVKLL